MLLKDLPQDWLRDIIDFLDRKSLCALRRTSKLFYKLITDRFGMAYEDFILSALKEKHKIIHCPNFDGIHSLLVELHKQGYNIDMESNNLNFNLKQKVCKLHENPIGNIFYCTMYYPHFVKQSKGDTIVIAHKITRIHRDKHFIQSNYGCDSIIKSLPFLQPGDCMGSLRVNIYNVKRKTDAFDHITKTRENLDNSTDFFRYPPYEYSCSPLDICDILSERYKVYSKPTKVLVHFYIHNVVYQIILLRVGVYEFFEKIGIYGGKGRSIHIPSLRSIKRAKEYPITEKFVYGDPCL